MKYLDIKQAVKQYQVSSSSIRRAIKNKTVRIKKRKNKSEKYKIEVESLENLYQKPREKPQIRPQQKPTNNKILQVLQGQLLVKDKQIKQLSSQLDKQQQLLNQQQQLQAGLQKQLLLESKSKKGWFKRLFSKE